MTTSIFQEHIPKYDEFTSQLIWEEVERLNYIPESNVPMWHSDDDEEYGFLALELSNYCCTETCFVVFLFWNYAPESSGKTIVYLWIRIIKVLIYLNIVLISPYTMICPIIVYVLSLLLA